MSSSDGADDTGFVAVTAMAGRFPGAPDVETLWDNLCHERESVPTRPDGPRGPAGLLPFHGLVDGPDLFDADHFDMTADEALVTDPQHRLLLECAAEALERAGHGGAEPGPTGVFVGGSITDHAARVRAWAAGSPTPPTESRIQQGNDPDFLATRISYTLDLTGPAVVVQSACSSSLVAVHVAVGALLAGDCAMAVAGGASVPAVVPATRHDPDDIYADDGRCRPFDASGRGTVRAAAVGLVVLRPLDEALEAGDPIHAVIRGTAVNNDGRRTMGFGVPGVAGPADAARAAQLLAGVDAEDIGYVEAHGTGTALGDPVEIAGLTRAFRRSTDRTQFCRVGSVKGNIGHPDAAAGVVGLIKTVLCVERGVIPASLNFREPNPAIDFAASPFVVADRTVAWETGGADRIGAVNALALGGTNAHAVVGQAPPVDPGTPDGTDQLLVLSARTGPALRIVADRLADHLDRHPDLDLADVAWTLQTGRRAHAARRHLVAADLAEAAAALRADAAAGQAPDPARAELDTLGRRWVDGEDVDLTALHDGRRRRVRLPTHPLRRHSHLVPAGGSHAPAGERDVPSTESGSDD